MTASSFSFLTSASLPIFGAGWLSYNLKSLRHFFRVLNVSFLQLFLCGKEGVALFEALYVSELKVEARPFTPEFLNILKLRCGGYLMGVTQVIGIW